MKKLLCLLWILLLATMAGCSRQGDTASPPAPSAQAQPAPAAAPPPAPDAQAAITGAATGDPSQEAVPEIPICPGATIAGRETENGKDGWTSAAEVKLTTTADFPSTRAFYDNVVKTGGWQVATFSDLPNKTYWRLTKGAGTVVEIEVETSRTGAVRVKIERKDR